MSSDARDAETFPTAARITDTIMYTKLLSTALAFIAVLCAACHDDDADVKPETSVVIGGKEYPTIRIGSQIWTAINYDGPGGTPYDVENSIPEYGKYYLEEELASITLPQGWRIPSKDDYTKLAEFYNIPVPSNMEATEKLRSLISATKWNNVTGTNASGFNAYPAGYTYGDAAPIGGDISEFWTSDGVTFSIQEAGEDLSSLRVLFYQSNNNPGFRFNVRFVK